MGAAETRGERHTRPGTATVRAGTTTIRETGTLLSGPPGSVAGQGDDVDKEALQRYMGATEAERAEIDQVAAEPAKPALVGVGNDKHAGIMLQARIAVAREYFHNQETKG